MVRNSEKKMTRKIRKNRQTRRKRVLKMKTKMRENRMHKTMKGGDLIRLTTLREQLKSTGYLGKQINESLNNIALSIGRKLKIKDDFITSYHAALKLTNPPAPNQGFMNVAPAAGSTPMIQFIPDSFGKIPDSIEVLILKIMEQYSKLCSAFRGRSNPCGDRHNLYKLTPDEFDQVLRDVCVGQVHKDSCIRGMDCVRLKDDDKYVKLKDSLYNFTDRPSHGTSSQKSPNLDFTVVRQDRIHKVNSIYSNLNTILPNELLNPVNIIYKACIIVMPPFRKSPPVFDGHRMDMVDPITRGYKSFIGGKPLYEWTELKKGEHLAPNMYCENRQNKRTLFGRPEYTMSPLEIPKDLLVPVVPGASPAMPSYDFQKSHDDGLDAMVAMVGAITTNLQHENKEKLRSDFAKDNKVEMIHIFDQHGYYFYYELEIQNTNIPLDSTQNTVGAVIIKFKVFSEDGICSKEIIFVSYKRPEEGSVIPGAVLHNDNEQVSTEMMNSAINKLFNEMFLELERSLYQVTTDQHVLTLKDEHGTNLSGRSGPAPPPVPLQSETLVPLNPQSGICTIVLSRSIGNTASTLSVAKATPTQQRAFNAVNKHITENTEWNFERDQKTFKVTNRMEDINKIEVIVRILKVNPSKKLISATYQAQDTPQYLLFATPKDATDYIDGIMVV